MGRTQQQTGTIYNGQDTVANWHHIQWAGHSSKLLSYTLCQWLWWHKPRSLIHSDYMILRETKKNPRPHIHIIRIKHNTMLVIFCYYFKHTINKRMNEGIPKFSPLSGCNRNKCWVPNKTKRMTTVEENLSETKCPKSPPYPPTPPQLRTPTVKSATYSNTRTCHEVATDNIHADGRLL
jgi:hypothetical protein